VSSQLTTPHASPFFFWILTLVSSCWAETERSSIHIYRPVRLFLFPSVCWAWDYFGRVGTCLLPKIVVLFCWNKTAVLIEWNMG
jgi:hypothetical protein